MVKFAILVFFSAAVSPSESVAEPTPCNSLDAFDGKACNCTECAERGGNWRFFTNADVERVHLDAYVTPMRWCLQLDSTGRPQKPDSVVDSEWKLIVNATYNLTVIGDPAQCPELRCPQFTNCGDCTGSALPCLWRGPAPGLQKSAGTCMYVDGSYTFSQQVKWPDIGMEEQASRRNCSVRGLLPRNRTNNLCSSCNKEGSSHNSRCGCAKSAPDEHAVCLVGDSSQPPFDCKRECDLYSGACRGVHVLSGSDFSFRNPPPYNQTDECFSCLLFEECMEPADGEQSYVVDMGPPAYGDWITKGLCPGGCEGYRRPGVEIPPLAGTAVSSFTPWFPDQKQCLQDSKCKYCTYQYPVGAYDGRTDDPGCMDKAAEPYRAELLDPNVKAYCAWDQAIDLTPASACAQHSTYGACAGAVSVGCQWCLSRTPANRFNQEQGAADPTLADRLKPQCVYYLDALDGCLTLRSVRRMPAQSQIPLLALFEEGKLYDARELSCGPHQLFGSMLTMVSENQTRDRWYTSDDDFSVSSQLDLAFSPMYVPAAQRDRQLAKLEHCQGYNSVREASKECQHVFFETCSSCLRTAGCWWSDQGLKTKVSGDWIPDFAASSNMPGCFHAKAQQSYVKTTASLSSDPTVPLRVLTVPEDSQFCVDPCWSHSNCSSCLGQGAGRCQWCGFSDADGQYCRSVKGPYQQCSDKYTKVEACPPPAPPIMSFLNTASEGQPSLLSPFPSQQLHLAVHDSSVPLEPDAAWYSSCTAALAVLIILPLTMVLLLQRIGIRRQRNRASMNTAVAGRALLDNIKVGDDTARGVSSPSPGRSPAISSHVELRFSGLGFRAKVGHEEKQVLSGVSGSVSSGEFLAVMGPSGSGKTTLLDVLAKRKVNVKACDGDVMVNGSIVTPGVRSYCGGLTEFVSQQDTLLEVQTVAEMLRFVADLKLPSTMSSAEKDERVRETIAMVGLQERANAYIGNNLLRGLSGGERRRASIAAALVPRAPVIFLDEPTSGLSSTDSLRVVEMLGELAKSHGYAVVAVVHQPQSRLFSHFDKLLLLSAGQVCYTGSASDAVGWFERVTSSPMPSAMNPADWLLDIITPGFIGTDAIAQCKRQVAHERELPSDTSASSLSSDNRAPVDNDLPSVDLSRIPEFATTSWKQFRVVAYRCFQTKIRRWQVLLVRFAVNLGVAAVAGLALPLAYPLYVDGFTSEPARQINAVLFFVVTFEGLIALTVLPLFNVERELFSMERKAKLYRLLPYFIANFLAETVVQAYSSLLFGGTFYVLVGVSHDWSRLLFYLLATVLVGECASSFAQLCSSSSRSIVNSLALCAMGLGCFLLFSGFLVLPSSMKSFFLPVYHLSFWKYGFQALTINEYAGVRFPCQTLNYSMATQCPPFGFNKDCPPYPCTNKSSGDVASIDELYRFNAYAEVHSEFVNSHFAERFLGQVDARQVNCRLLCGLEDAPGRYQDDDCVCTALGGCRNDTEACDPIFWKDARGSCANTRALNGVFANGTCAAAVESVAGEYFLDLLGFGRVDAKGKPKPEDDPELADSRSRYVASSPRVTKYVWLGALCVITFAFRVANFVLLVRKRD